MQRISKIALKMAQDSTFASKDYTMLNEMIKQLEMRVASLEKEAKGSKIQITIPSDYGYDFEEIPLKKFVKLAKGGRFELKDYGEGIVILTKEYIDWHNNVDWETYNQYAEEDQFKGIERFEVSLQDICRALLTSVGAKEESAYLF